MSSQAPALALPAREMLRSLTFSPNGGVPYAVLATLPRSLHQG